MPNRDLYQVKDKENELFEMALAGNINAFTNYYLRGPNTGSWWLPGAKTKNWARGYSRLHKYWLAKDRPERFDYESKTYQLFKKHPASEEHPNQPAFFQNHGFYVLPFGQTLFKDRTDIRTLIAGWGSGKTLNMAAVMLCWAVLYEEFRGWSLGPEAKQANEFVRAAWGIMQGTLFMERFYRHYTAGPNAVLRLGNSRVGETLIEAYPLLKREDSLLTLTGDAAVIDQAEKFDNLDDAIKFVGSRFRGRVVSSGRERLGTLTLLANSAYNDLLWQIHAKGDVENQTKEEHGRYLSMTFSSYDNPYLTDRDLARYQNLAGNDPEEIRIHLMGGRPLGDGKEFSKDVLKRMQDQTLDDQMTTGLRASLPGYSFQDEPGIGVHEWMLPYEEHHKYLVISDPGADNPPRRNAFAILVWDITSFPVEAARLVGYVWGFGKGDIQNWANKHAELVWRFHAIATNGFDATGLQSGYDHWIAILKNLEPEKINLGGNNKADCLNSAKMLASAGRLKVPLKVHPLFSQLQMYELPEPTKLRQDLVMAFIMSCWWLKRLYYWALPDDENPWSPNPWKEGRYDRVTEDRYERPRYAH